MRKKIIILHEFGAPNHFRALEYLLKYQYPDVELVYGELSIKAVIKKIIRNKDFSGVRRLPGNLKTLVMLYFQKNHLVILGISPYSFRLAYLLKMLKHHQVFYITSWAFWEEDHLPKSLFKRNKVVQNAWKIFLEQTVSGIFCVTQKSLNSLSERYKLNCKNAVVYHSFDASIYHPPKNILRSNIPIKCIFAGDFIPEKGLPDIFELIDRLDEKEFQFSFAGRGPLKREVAHLAASKKNVRDLGYIRDQKTLAHYYRESDVLLFPTKSELFGMVLIEAMACGTAVISNDQVGPKEILEMGNTGYLCNEENFVEYAYSILKNLSESPNQLYEEKKKAIEFSQQFAMEKIAPKWDLLLKNHLQN